MTDEKKITVWDRIVGLAVVAVLVVVVFGFASAVLGMFFPPSYHGKVKGTEHVAVIFEFDDKSVRAWYISDLARMTLVVGDECSFTASEDTIKFISCTHTESK